MPSEIDLVVAAKNAVVVAIDAPTQTGGDEIARRSRSCWDCQECRADRRTRRRIRNAAARNRSRAEPCACVCCGATPPHRPGMAAKRSGGAKEKRGRKRDSFIKGRSIFRVPAIANGAPPSPCCRDEKTSALSSCLRLWAVTPNSGLAADGRRARQHSRRPSGRRAAAKIGRNVQDDRLHFCGGERRPDGALGASIIGMSLRKPTR